MSLTSSLLSAAVTRNPAVITPETSVERVIELLTAPNGTDIASPETLKTSRVDFVSAELHDVLRARYLVVMEASIWRVVTTEDLLLLERSDPRPQTIAQCDIPPCATLPESELVDLRVPLNLLRQQQMRPIVVLDDRGSLAGLLTYEELHAVARASNLQPAMPLSSLPTPVRDIAGDVAVSAQPDVSTPDVPTLDRSVQQVISKITAQVHSSLEVQTVLDTAVEEMRAVLDCDRAIAYRLRSDLTGKVIAEAISGDAKSVLHSEVHDPCVTPEWLEPYRHGKVRIVDDVYEAEMSVCHQEMLTGFGIRSKMMVPIVVVGGEIWGLIVVSEQHRPRHWQPEEIELVRQLGVQVAIAMQQAQAHERAQHELEERCKAEQQLQDILDVTATKTGVDFFPVSMMQLAESLNVAHVLLTERVGDALRTLAFVVDRSLQPTYEYQIAGTPCEKVLDRGAFHCNAVQKLFPEDTDLIDLEAESYFGFSMQDSKGEVVGHLCVLDREPLRDVKRAENLIRSFAVRATAELERTRALDALEALNHELEEKVEARTADLRASYQKLENAQMQLVQSEKMSSLGQLVAGVAHEINNPVNFIYGNLAPCLDYFEDLAELIELYQQHYDPPHSEISSFMEDADIPYTLQDFPKLIQSIQTGASRIQEIVQSLRTFSHAQQEGSKAIDIHANIDTTLVILQNRLNGRAGKPKIEVVKAYGDLPPVKCYGGQLNQVFMNLLVNGIDAIEQRQEQGCDDPPGCLTIETSLVSPDTVAIAIADNGMGMDCTTRGKVFDPFFTTKPVGVGTGMGLSIAYKIVTGDHQGQLYCQSKMGKGTKFIVELPVSGTLEGAEEDRQLLLNR